MILALLSLALTACASAEPLQDVAPFSNDPTVSIALKSIQGSDVTVEITATNFKAVPVSQASAPHVYKEGHYQLFLDVPPTAPGEVIPATTGIYETTDSVYTIHNVPNGRHTLWAVLAYTDKLPYQAVRVVDFKPHGAVAELKFDVNGSNYVAPSQPLPQPSQSTAANPSPAPSTSTTAPGGAVTEVKVEYDAANQGKYVPNPVSVHTGATAKWVFNDDQGGPHTVTADDGSFDSQPKVTGNKGDTFTFTFTKAGSYPYHCSYHANMKGTLTIS